MNRTAKRLFLLLGACSVALLAQGCMKPEAADMAGHKPGMYAGKPDTHPYEAAKTDFTYGTWSAGDKAAWQANLRARNQNQNEYNKAPSAK